MTKDEFKQLKPGDRFRHPINYHPFTIKSVEAYNGETHAITTTDGRRMKIIDAEVANMTKVEE